MRYTIFTLAAAASFASAQSPSSPASASPTGALIPVGENCDPNGTPCALGANCYATNSMLQTVCGNFQASCTNDQQCAFNTCNLEQGLCNGFIASSSASSSSASATITTTPTAPGPMPAPSSTIVAPAGSLPLGAECNPFVNPSQCANGVDCWASNAMLIARCGNFNAACSSDTQCAYNACSGGLCRGFLPSSAMPVQPSSMMNGTVPMQPTGTGAAMPTGNATATSTGSLEFTGAASVDNVAGGIMAIVFGAVALAL
ncbi:hypothetical protein G6011_04949 [Alternaria panax]|uniref:Uncharacterized protein n=1 Tax=Alternaria panax TaxID=48097 RepID=A0AAD4I632_9PLEO|nr:hypothetical protein G6011_04949 [Alternaria panax]